LGPTVINEANVGASNTAQVKSRTKPGCAGNIHYLGHPLCDVVRWVLAHEKTNVILDFEFSILIIQI
jgi:hypothetical protein